MGGVPVPDGGPDDELVRRAAAGETHAFARLIRVHHELLTRTALVVTGDLDAAARAVHDAWPAAWQGLGHHAAADGPPILPWLAGLAVDEAVEDMERRARRKPPTGPDTAAGDRGGDPDDIGVRLAAMRPRDRAVVGLHVLAGQTPERLDRLPAGLPDPDRVRAWADQPVRPVDADATAAWARSEAQFARNHRWSVLAGAAAGLFVAGFPYLAGLIEGR